MKTKPKSKHNHHPFPTHVSPKPSSKLNLTAFEELALILDKLRLVIKEFVKPSIILICLAGSIRNAGNVKSFALTLCSFTSLHLIWNFQFQAGTVWAYNNNSYYKFLNQTPDQISSYLGTIPIFAGIIGSFLGKIKSTKSLCD